MKFLIFFFLSLSIAASAQLYKFDYMLKSENTRDDAKYNHTSFDMINSNDHTYYMNVGSNSVTGMYRSLLFDHSKKELYIFYINNRKMVSPLLFTFKGVGVYNDRQFLRYNDLQIVKIGNHRYRIIGKSKKKSKKNEIEIILELEPHTNDLLLFNFEPLTSLQQQEIITLLKNTLKSENESGNFYIKEITFHYFKDSLFQQKITPVKIDVNLNIQ